MPKTSIDAQSHIHNLSESLVRARPQLSLTNNKKLFRFFSKLNPPMHWHNLVMVVCARIKLLYLIPNQPTNGRQISLSCQVNTWLVPQATLMIKLMLCGETERICRKLSHFWRFEQSRYIIIRESAHNNPVRLSALGRAIRVVVRLPNPLPRDLWCQAGNLSTRVVV